MRWPVKLLKISGHSMEPTLRLGSFVLVWCWTKNYHVGDIIAFRYDNKILIKRISSITIDAVEVRGDNATDSLPIDPIDMTRIIGRKILH